MTHTMQPNTRPPLPRAFFMSLLATFMFALGVTILIPILPLYITDGLSLAEHWIGTATLFVAFTAVTLRIPSGAFSDRHGRRAMMLVGAAAGVGASILYTLSSGLLVFMLARLATGFSLALFTTAAKALAADLAPAIRRGEAMGLSNAAFSLATVISPLLSEGIKNEVSFQAVFVLSGILTIGALGVSYALPRTLPERSTNPGARGDILETLRERGTWASILMLMGLGAILALMFTFYPLLAERKGFYADAPRLLFPIAMGIGLSIWAIVDTVAEPLAGALSDRIGRQPVAVPGLLVAVGGVFVLSRAHNTISAYVAIALMAAGWGTARAIADSISQDAVPPVLRGMGAAVIYTSFDLAVGLDAQVLGSLIDGSDFGAFFTATIAASLVFGLAGILLTRRLLSYDQRVTCAATGD